MKKIDKLVLTSFMGPFLLTFSVVIFIFLLQFILNYFEDLVGKGLGFFTYVELLSYFSIILIPVALPLAVLLSSLITFGNLGEHYELTAIKSSGVSLLRVLRPIFILTLFIAFGDMYFSDKILPKVSIKAFRLLYDIKTKKASLNLKEGSFYNDLPGFSIKVNKKFPDHQTLKELIIYDHSKNNGNTDVTLADSGKMYTLFKDNYLILELFNGCIYQEQYDNQGTGVDKYIRNRFKQSKIVFNLSSFSLGKTPEELFSSSKVMKTVSQLSDTVKAMKKEAVNLQKNILVTANQFYSFHQKKDLKSKTILFKSTYIDSIIKRKKNIYESINIYNRAAGQAKSMKDHLRVNGEQINAVISQSRDYEVERWKRYTDAVACLVMFFIGAPLGAIIKKGGLGMPVLVSILFFIFYYVLTSNGTKLANEGYVNMIVGNWLSNAVLFVIGIFFLVKAKDDSRLLEADVYRIAFDKFKKRFFPEKKKVALL